MAVKRKPKFVWQEQQDPDGIVLFTRCRIARNLLGIPFIERNAEQTKAYTKIAQILKKRKWQVHRLKELSNDDLTFYQDTWCITKELRSNPDGGFALRPHQGLSIMLGEEDHLRIQCLQGGLQIEPALSSAYAIEDILAKTNKFAYDTDLGYLTSCPTNLGTGLRLSVFMHLRALYLDGRLADVLKEASENGLQVRGVAGEGSLIDGPLVQISNKGTLGPPEYEIARRFADQVRHLVSAETKARKDLKKTKKIEIEDLVRRSYAILKEARLMDYDESLAHLSLVYLGMQLKLIPLRLEPTLGSFIVRLRDSYFNGGTKNPELVRKQRASFLRATFAKSVA